MRKAFTFAELMISLVIIAVLSAILYPTILQFTPNTNKPLFKAAYRTLSSAISAITNDLENEKINATDAANGTNICKLFCEKMNIVPENNHDDTCDTMCADSIITTSNGAKLYFYPYLEAGYDGADYAEGTIPNVFKIVVDVNSTNNTLDNTASVPRDLPFANGVFYYTPTDGDTGIYSTAPTSKYAHNGVFNADNLEAQDTFEILINLEGEIVSMSPAAWANLEDDEQTEN